MGVTVLAFKSQERRSLSSAEIAIRFDQERRAALEGERNARRAAVIAIVVALAAIAVAFYFFAERSL